MRQWECLSLLIKDTLIPTLPRAIYLNDSDTAQGLCVCVCVFCLIGSFVDAYFVCFCDVQMYVCSIMWVLSVYVCGFTVLPPDMLKMLVNLCFHSRGEALSVFDAHVSSQVRHFSCSDVYRTSVLFWYWLKCVCSTGKLCPPIHKKLKWYPVKQRLVSS